MKKLFFTSLILLVTLAGIAQDSTIIDVSYVKAQLAGLSYSEQIETLNQAYLDRLHTEPALSEEIMKLALKISTQKNDSSGIAESLYLLGKAKREHGKSNESIAYINKGLVFYKKLNKLNRISDCLNELGIAYKNLGEFQQSLNYYFEALEIATQTNYLPGEVRSLTNIAVILMHQGNHKQAINYLKQTLYLEQDESKKSSIYNNIGVCYNALGMKSEALVEYEKSIASAKLAGDSYSEATPTYNIAVILLERKELEKAFGYFSTLEKISLQSGDKKGLIGIYLNFGLINRLKGQYEDAIEDFFKANNLAIETKSPVEQKMVYLNLSLAYEELGKYVESLDYLYLYINLNDSLFTETKNQQMAELISKFEADKKQKEIELLKQERNIKELAFEKQRSEIQLQELRIEAAEEKKQAELALLQNQNEIQQLVLDRNVNQIERLKLNASLNKTLIAAEKTKAEKETTIRNVTILISLLIVIPVIILLIVYQQKIKAQSIIAIRTEQLNQKKILELIKDFEIKTFKAQLEGQEIERKRIASDLHDGIGGNLAGIKLGLSKIDDNMGGNSGIKSIMAQVNETCEEIRSISHDLTPSKILNTAYIELIREYIFQTIESEHVNVGFQAYPESKLDYISDDIKIEVYRIIQELLSNVMKHSKAKEVDISLNLNNESLILMIEDSGIGFNPNKMVKGIGLLNIESRVASVNGKLSIDSIIGRGTIYTVEIPLT